MTLPDEETVAYFRRLVGERSDAFLGELEKDAQRRGIPILGPAAAGFVAGLARIQGGGRMLELGTATGYSAIVLGRVALETGGRVVTVERDEAMVLEARGNMAKAGLDGVVEVVHGDALAYLQDPGDSFDLVLLDIDKSEYASALPAVVARLNVGGVLVADNAGFPEVREFNSTLMSDARLETSVVYGFWAGHSPEWDAVAVGVKRASEAGAKAGPLG